MTVRRSRTTGGALRLREITDPEDPALASAYALLRRTFPKNERVSIDEWRATLVERAGKVWTDFSWHLVVAQRGNRVMGLATGTYIGSVNVGIIGYLAIDPTMRSGGIGTRIRARLRDRFRSDARKLSGRELSALLGEVSADNPWLRRLARHPRILVLDVPSFQPGLRPSDEPSPFALYYEAIGRNPRWVAASELRKILFAIWRHAYRVSRPLDRAVFRQIIASLDGRRRVGPHPVYQPRRK